MRTDGDLAAKGGMAIETTRWGVLTVPPEALVEIEHGLIGIRGRRYAVVAPEPGGAFHWLQSVETASLAVPVANPWSLFPDFELELSDAAMAQTGIPEGGSIDVWVTARPVGRGWGLSANLRAPILVHEGRGHQVINEAAHAPVRAPLLTGARGTAA